MPATKKKRTGTRRASPTSRSSARGRNNRSGMDAIALLKRDHQTVRQLLKKLESSAENGRAESAALLRQIENELTVHTQIEEEIFYPAFRDAVDGKKEEKLYYEALEEHHVVDLIMPEIKNTSRNSEEFPAKAKVLKDIVEHHAEEEESEMFPKARKAMGAAALRELGQRLQERKQQLMGGFTGRIERMLQPFTREGRNQRTSVRNHKRRAA
jgi:hemerythrin-like domain-containing protein